MALSVVLSGTASNHRATGTELGKQGGSTYPSMLNQNKTKQKTVKLYIAEVDGLIFTEETEA